VLSITEVAGPLSQGGMYPSFSFTFFSFFYRCLGNLYCIQWRPE
jgi:hypothetical protein